MTQAFVALLLFFVTLLSHDPSWALRVSQDDATSICGALSNPQHPKAAALKTATKISIGGQVYNFATRAALLKMCRDLGVVAESHENGVGGENYKRPSFVSVNPNPRTMGPLSLADSNGAHKVENSPVEVIPNSRPLLAGGLVQDSNNPCSDAALTSLIPEYEGHSPTFPAGEKAYRDHVKAEILGGNIPPHLKNLQPVLMEQSNGRTCLGKSGPITLCAMPEPIAIGRQDDYLYTPMRHHDAAEVLKALGFMLPTPEMVNGTYRNATYKVPPINSGDPRRSLTRGWYADGSMGKPYRFKEQAIAVREQVAYQAQENGYRGELVHGTHKDMVIMNGMKPVGGENTFAQYGWIKENGRPIQNAGFHHGGYHMDYSLVPRPYSQWALVGGKWEPLGDLLKNGDCAATLNGGAPLTPAIVDYFRNSELKKPGEGPGDGPKPDEVFVGV